MNPRDHTASRWLPDDGWSRSPGALESSAPAGPRDRCRTSAEETGDANLTRPRRLSVGELAAQILVDGLQSARTRTRTPEGAAVAAAHVHGRRAGEEAIAHEGPLGPDPEARRDRLVTLLTDLGFETRATDRGVFEMTSCPFHPLAHRSPRLTSILNRAFLTGLLQGLGLDDMEALLGADGPDDCCGRVTLGHLAMAT